MFISVLLITSVFWANRTFAVTSLSQVVFLIKAPITGTDSSIFRSWALWSLIPTVVSTIIGGMGLLNIYKIFKNKEIGNTIKAKTDKLFLIIMAIFLFASLLFASINYDVYGYFNNIIQTSSIYEEHYISPNTTTILFPQKKRNVIHIYLESIESTFVSPANGGGMKQSYIFELEQLAKENINFSANQNIGGSKTVVGTQWTIAAMVSQSAGIPLSIPIGGNSYGGSTQFLPGSYTIGQVLENQGYTNEIILGSDSSFAGTKNFYQQHGNYDIVDYNEILSQQRIPEDYHQFWGFEDQQLFTFAKEDILELSASNQPFNMEIVTMDTHMPDGYLCQKCPTTYTTKYENILACQSMQVGDFVQWAKEQEFYKNTTIVITGDHTSMITEFFKDVDPAYLRMPYNVIINSAVAPVNSKNRQFSSMDWYPTILASMGATIEGERLGLGTNLFSDKPTLLEELGFDVFNSEVQKASAFYNQEILKLK